MRFNLNTFITDPILDYDIEFVVVGIVLKLVLIGQFAVLGFFAMTDIGNFLIVGTIFCLSHPVVHNFYNSVNITPDKNFQRNEGFHPLIITKPW